MSNVESTSGAYYRQSTVEVGGIQLQPSRSRTKQTRNQRAQYKIRRNREQQLQRTQPGCDAGGRVGGSIGSRRPEPAGWQLREGCKCALHYGGECTDFVKNSATDRPRRKKQRPSMPQEHLRCYRCQRIGHLVRDCVEPHFDATKKRPRVEYAPDSGKIFVTVDKSATAGATVDYSSDESENKLVIDEAQPDVSDSEVENWDEPCQIGSPGDLQEDSEEESRLEGYEVRSIAEISEEEEEEFGATEQFGEIPTIIVPPGRLPSPDEIFNMIKDSENKLRKELARRAAIRREEERVAAEQRIATEAMRRNSAAALVVRNRTPDVSRITRSQTVVMPQPSPSQQQSQTSESRSDMYDRLIKTIERAQRQITEMENQ